MLRPKQNVPIISQQHRHTCQVPANLDTVEHMDRLNELLAGVGSVLATSVSPVHLAVACMVVWKLAESAGESTLGKQGWGEGSASAFDTHVDGCRPGLSLKGQNYHKCPC